MVERSCAKRHTCTSTKIKELQHDLQITEPDNDVSKEQTKHGQYMYFYSVDEQRQHTACAMLGVQFVRCNEVCPGGPNVSLAQPRNRKVKHIAVDGNHLFWSFSYIIAGSEEHIHCAIVYHMVGNAHLLLSCHVPSQFTSIQQYTAATRMNHSRSWGTTLMIDLSSILTAQCDAQRNIH